MEHSWARPADALSACRCQPKHPFTHPLPGPQFSTLTLPRMHHHPSSKSEAVPPPGMAGLERWSIPGPAPPTPCRPAAASLNTPSLTPCQAPNFQLPPSHARITTQAASLRQSHLQAWQGWSGGAFLGPPRRRRAGPPAHAHLAPPPTATHLQSQHPRPTSTVPRSHREAGEAWRGRVRQEVWPAEGGARVPRRAFTSPARTACLSARPRACSHPAPPSPSWIPCASPDGRGVAGKGGW